MFSIISEKHRAKIKHLCQKNNLEIQKPPENLQGVDKAWLEDIAHGDGRENVKTPPQVPQYGVIEPPLDEDELAAAGMPPKFATLGKISRSKGKHEAVTSQTKQRWSRRREGNPQEQENEWNNGAHEEEIDHQEVIIQNQEREVYKPDKKSIDWRCQKATDMRNNSKVFLPRARPKGEEIIFNTQDHVFDKVYQEYISQNCNEKGEQTESNISNSDKSKCFNPKVHGTNMVEVEEDTYLAASW